MRRLLLPLLALAVLAPPAHAAPVTHKDISYSVEYQGIGKYDKLDQRDMGTDFWSEEEISLDFTFSGEIGEGVVFRDGHPFDTTGRDLGTDTVSGKVAYRGAGGEGMTCPVADNVFATGWMRLTEEPLGALDGQTHLWLRPFESFDVMFDCGGSFPSIDLVALGDRDDDGDVVPGEHTFDTPFSLPPEVFGMGYIEQIIPQQIVNGERCPGRLSETVECRLEWSGKVIFRKLWENTVTSKNGEVLPPSTHKGDVPMEIAPLVAPAPKPKPAPKPPVADDEIELAPLVEKGSAKLDASGKVATVTVSCGGGCAGTASIVAGGGGARAAAARPLARAKFRVPAGRKAAKVRVKLGTKARRKLRRVRTAKLRLAFTKPARRTHTLALRLPRR